MLFRAFRDVAWAYDEGDKTTSAGWKAKPTSTWRLSRPSWPATAGPRPGDVAAYPLRRQILEPGHAAAMTGGTNHNGNSTRTESVTSEDTKYRPE